MTSRETIERSLKGRGWLTAVEISQITGEHRSMVSLMLNRMKRKGKVQRRIHPKDSRKIQYRIR